MLNEAPKKRKKDIDYAHPGKWTLFRRVQWECFRRAVTPYLMYLFMSLICLVCQLGNNVYVHTLLGSVCILAGAAYNAHLCYHYGKLHYGSLVAGELHRKNELFGIESGGDHRPEREFRVWKGFLIGLYVALPVIILGAVAGSIPSAKLASSAGGLAYYALAMFAGWAVIPITWMGTVTAPDGTALGLRVTPYWSIAFSLLPILVSGCFYLIGAYVEKKSRLAEVKRSQDIIEAGERAAKEVREKSQREGKKK